MDRRKGGPLRRGRSRPRPAGRIGARPAAARTPTRVATPVLIATARDRVADRIAGLDAGADDYMVKPIDLDELPPGCARSSAASRDAPTQP